MSMDFDLPGNMGWILAAVVIVSMLASLRSRAHAQINRMTAPVDENHLAVKPLPENVQELLRSGNKVEAIKALREATDMNLTDAHSAVSHWQSDDGSVRVQRSVEVYTSGDLPPDIVELIKNGKTVTAVRRLRQEAGMKTGDARRAVQRVNESSATAAEFNSPQNNPVNCR